MSCDHGYCRDECSIPKDVCKFCKVKRDVGTKPEMDDEKCPIHISYIQEMAEGSYYCTHELIPVVKGTDLKFEQMVLKEIYVASDYTSVPDC